MENKLSKNIPKKEHYISSLLVLHGINQNELAKKVGVSRPFFCNVIHGKRGGTKKAGPKAEAIRQIVADTLGMTIEELWPIKILKEYPSDEKSL